MKKENYLAFKYIFTQLFNAFLLIKDENYNRSMFSFHYD